MKSGRNWDVKLGIRKSLIVLFLHQTAVQRKMLLRRAVAVIGTRHQEVVEAHRWWWQSSLKTTTPAAWPVKFPLPPPRLPYNISRWLVTAVVMAVLMLKTTPCCCLEVRCPAVAESESYCQCTKENIRSGSKIIIKCDLQQKEVGVDRIKYDLQ